MGYISSITVFRNFISTAHTKFVADIAEANSLIVANNRSSNSDFLKNQH